MLQEYIESFEKGSISDHKDSQRAWIKDKSPVVESNMGWIEHYVDP
jgi:dipeptidyl-peptidase-3